MRTIIKSPEPHSLTEYKHIHGASYDGYRDQDGLKASLVTEQRGLCCYCLRRIRPQFNGMKVEHWHSQAHYPDEQLLYSNLLGACMGNEGQPRDHQHCDTRKGDSDFSRNPANPMPRVEDLIRFQGDGQIASDNAAFGIELNEVLNLNEPYLRNSRKEVLEAFKGALEKRGHLSRATIVKWSEDWNGALGGSELREFCQVVVYWLRKRLARP